MPTSQLRFDKWMRWPWIRGGTKCYHCQDHEMPGQWCVGIIDHNRLAWVDRRCSIWHLRHSDHQDSWLPLGATLFESTVFQLDLCLLPSHFVDNNNNCPRRPIRESSVWPRLDDISDDNWGISDVHRWYRGLLYHYPKRIWFLWYFINHCVLLFWISYGTKGSLSIHHFWSHRFILQRNHVIRYFIRKVQSTH